MRKQKLMRMAAMAAAGMLLMTGCAGGNSQATTAAATAAPETTQAAETTKAEDDGAEEAGEADMPSVPEGVLVLAKQGMFSSGGTVTQPVEGEYDETQNWLDSTRAGNTAHVDHANVLYQIPAGDNGNPIVYLHGYGQSRMGWMTTPDGREGWSDIFLKKGHSAFLVDQPRRGEAGSTARMTTDGIDKP